MTNFRGCMKLLKQVPFSFLSLNGARVKPSVREPRRKTLNVHVLSLGLFVCFLHLLERL